MSDDIQIQLLGIAAVKIKYNNRNLYIDAFNSFNENPKLEKNDIILFTHSDHDHFLCEKLKGQIYDTNIIIGPPSISYPILDSGIVRKKQLKIYYPNEYTETEEFIDNGIKIEIFNTDHFVEWHNIHVSFLIEINDKRIYITGDSDIRDENINQLQDLDFIIYSLMEDSIIKGKIDKRYGKYLHIWQLVNLNRKLNPKKLIGNHLLQCDWSVDPEELKEIIIKEKLDNVVIPVSVDEIIQ